jgi:hypothetical protein
MVCCERKAHFELMYDGRAYISDFMMLELNLHRSGRLALFKDGVCAITTQTKAAEPAVRRQLTPTRHRPWLSSAAVGSVATTYKVVNRIGFAFRIRVR